MPQKELTVEQKLKVIDRLLSCMERYWELVGSGKRVFPESFIEVIEKLFPEGL